MSDDTLPDPLCAPDVDLHGLPIPREAFVQMAARQFGISIKEARAHVDRVTDAVDARRTRRRRR